MRPDSHIASNNGIHTAHYCAVQRTTISRIKYLTKENIARILEDNGEHATELEIELLMDVIGKSKDGTIMLCDLLEALSK